MSAFRLQRLLDHRRDVRDAARQRLSVAVAARIEAEAERDRLQALLDELHTQTAVALSAGPVEARELGRLHAVIRNATLAVGRAQQSVDEAAAREQQERALALQAEKEHKALSNAQTKHDERERAEQRRRGIAEQDELTGAKVARAILRGPNPIGECAT